MRDKPIAPSSPWQNAYAERLIGTIRRECLDHMIILEAHLRWILGKYAAYYNESRIHRSLNKDAPFSRAIEHLGVITSRPILGGGLHHQYCRILIFGTHRAEWLYRGGGHSLPTAPRSSSRSLSSAPAHLSFPKIPSGLGFAS